MNLVRSAGDLAGLQQIYAATPPGARRTALPRALIAGLFRIRDKEGRLVPLRANRAQLAFDGAAGQRNIVLKARQLGITTWIAARFFLATILAPGTLSVLVAHDQDAAEAIFRIVQRFYRHLPEAWRAGPLRASRANVRQLVFPALDSEYRVESAGDPAAGRGLTIANLHGSEVARWPGDAAATLASLRAALAPRGELVLESTPAGAGGCFYDEWQRAVETGAAQHFLPWWFAPEYRRERELGELSEDERALMRAHGLDAAQIAFRRELRANLRGLAPQEFAEDAESCFLAAGECVFDLEKIQARLAECRPPLAARDNGRFALWFPPEPGREYIVGADPAGGGALGDYACAQVIERASGLQCAELHGHFTPAEFAARIAALAHEYNGALLAVERNNHGHAVLLHLERIAKYAPLYAQRGQTGWATSPATRPRMIELFAVMVSEAPESFSSAALLRECRSFVRQADGSSRALAGAYDDRILAMAIALAVRDEVVGKFQNGNVRLASVPI